MMTHPALKLFLELAKMDSRSGLDMEAHPTSPGQTVVLDRIEEILKAGGVMGDQILHFADGSRLISFVGTKPGKKICYAAHVDSHPDAPGGAKCIVHEYKGGDIVLPEKGTVISATDKNLRQKVGRTIVTASGDTTLSADDKAGVAILVQIMLDLASGKIKDYPSVDFWLCVDEEVGQLDISVVPREIVESWDGLVTLDGENPQNVDTDCFCGWETIITFVGKSAHPGVDGDNLKPAHYALARLINQLEVNENQPWETSGFDSFIYVSEVVEMTVNKAVAKIHPRSFNRDDLPGMHEDVLEIARKAAKHYGVEYEVGGRGLLYVGTGTAIKQHPKILRPILDVVSKVVGQCEEQAVRGGTDGAMINIAYPNLPSPNLGVGMYNFHGVREFLVVEEMLATYEVMKRLVPAYAE